MRTLANLSTSIIIYARLGSSKLKDAESTQDTQEPPLPLLTSIESHLIHSHSFPFYDVLRVSACIFPTAPSLKYIEIHSAHIQFFSKLLLSFPHFPL